MAGYAPRAGRPMGCFLLLSLFAAGVLAAPPDRGPGSGLPAAGAGDDVVPGVVLVQFREAVPVQGEAGKTGLASVDRIAAKHQVSGIEKAFPILDRVSRKRPPSASARALQRTYMMRYDGPQRPEVVAASLAKDPHVAIAEPYFIHRVHGEAEAGAAGRTQGALATEPNDPFYLAQSHLKVVKLPEAWDVVKGEQGDIVIAIVDTGVDWDHPDLIGNVWTNPGEVDGNGLDDDGNGYVDDIHGWNFTTDQADPTGTGPQHGTSVAGIAAAVTNNAVGVAGASWNARFMPVATLCAGLSISLCHTNQGILYAAYNGADIINASYGVPNFSDIGQQVVDVAYEEGALIVAAAGNDSNSLDDIPGYPASYHRVLSVGGTLKNNDQRADFSAYGKSVDVFAPAQGIDSTSPNGRYTAGNGTSFSSPLVAGIAALVWTRFPAFTVDEVREQIRVTSDDIDLINAPRLMGRGRVNAFRAVTETGHPAVRLVGYTLRDEEGDASLDSGELIELSITVANFLDPVSDVKIVLTESVRDVTVVNQEATIPFLGRGDSATVSFTFRMADNAPDDLEFVVFIEPLAGAYADADIIRLSANLAAARHHSSGALQVSITEEANIGFAHFAGESPGVGFVTNGRNTLFEGGLLVATGPQRISDAVRNEDVTAGSQDEDFKLEEGTELQIVRPGRATYEQGFARYVENTATPIGITVRQETYLDTAAVYQDVAIFRYFIRNTSGGTLSNLYAGLFFDWDVDPVYESVDAESAADFARFDASQGFGYALDDLENPSVVVGSMLLNHADRLSYQAISNQEFIYDGFTAQEKWAFMTRGVQVTELNETDVSQLIAAGPFEIAAGDSVELAFALVGGATEADARTNAAAAQTLWDTNVSMVRTAVEDPGTTPLRFGLDAVYPHPVSGAATIRYRVAEPSQVTVAIYDVLGREVQRLFAGASGAGPQTVRWDGRDRSGQLVPSGLYVCRFTAAGPSTTFHQTRSLVVVR